MYRTKEFDSLLASQLQDVEFAREYFIRSMEDIDGEPGLLLFDALKDLIRKVGIKEYAEWTGMERQNLSRILGQNDPPKVETINRLLSPLNLRVRLEVEVAS